MFRFVCCIALLITCAGCHAKLYRFQFPRESTRVSSPFVAGTDFSLPGSPAPEIGLFNVAADPGKNRPGVICYSPTDIEQAVDQSGPKLWKRKFHDEVEYEFVAVPTIRQDKYQALRDALAVRMPNTTPTLVPCEVVLASIDVPGTLEGVKIEFSPYYASSGDIFWMIRLSTDDSLSGQLEDLMKSQTGLVVPTRATLAGVDLQISPPLEIKGSVLAREK